MYLGAFVPPFCRCYCAANVLYTHAVNCKNQPICRIKGQGLPKLQGQFSETYKSHLHINTQHLQPAKQGAGAGLPTHSNQAPAPGVPFHHLPRPPWAPGAICVGNTRRQQDASRPLDASGR
jgi:hypothetical protein